MSIVFFCNTYKLQNLHCVKQVSVSIHDLACRWTVGAMPPFFSTPHCNS